MRSPILVTADLDIVKEVFIKDFNNFRNRVINAFLSIFQYQSETDNS